MSSPYVERDFCDRFLHLVVVESLWLGALFAFKRGLRLHVVYVCISPMNMCGILWKACLIETLSAACFGLLFQIVDTVVF